MWGESPVSPLPLPLPLLWAEQQRPRAEHTGSTKSYMLGERGTGQPPLGLSVPIFKLVALDKMAARSLSWSENSKQTHPPPPPGRATG